MVGNVPIKFEENWTSIFQEKYEEWGFFVPFSSRSYTADLNSEVRPLRTYVENQAILEPILLYRTSKCIKTKEQGSEDCL